MKRWQAGGQVTRPEQSRAALLLRTQAAGKWDWVTESKAHVRQRSRQKPSESDYIHENKPSYTRCEIPGLRTMVGNKALTERIRNAQKEVKNEG
jgi:hypothetical protein